MHLPASRTVLLTHFVHSAPDCGTFLSEPGTAVGWWFKAAYWTNGIGRKEKKNSVVHYSDSLIQPFCTEFPFRNCLVGATEKFSDLNIALWKVQGFGVFPLICFWWSLRCGTIAGEAHHHSWKRG